MDEHGMVQYYDIVPYDTRDYMKNAFEVLWGTPDREVTTQAVYTDNVRSDTNMMQACFKSFTNHHHCLLFVLQDIWHAEQRVFKCMSSSHVDYKDAKRFEVFFDLIEQRFENYFCKIEQTSCI